MDMELFNPCSFALWRWKVIEPGNVLTASNSPSRLPSALRPAAAIAAAPIRRSLILENRRAPRRSRRERAGGEIAGTKPACATVLCRSPQQLGRCTQRLYLRPDG